MNKIDRWLDNLSDEALQQALRFILHSPDTETREKNIECLYDQVYEFAKMYPEYRD